MTLRLTVHEPRWREHVQAVAAEYSDLVPVVKGNGYGFRRWNLMPLAKQLSSEIAVGTVFEARDMPEGATAIVLTPTTTKPPEQMPASTVLTVGSVEHVVALGTFGWSGNVVVKLQSAMKRYGVSPAQFQRLIDEIRSTSLTIVGYSIHPPLAGDMEKHVKEIESWFPLIPSSVPLYVSHLNSKALTHLRKKHPDRKIKIRLGTALWHGDKSMLHLSADVVDHHPIEATQKAGYKLTSVGGPGEILLVGAGTAHGVTPLDDGRSPFHFQRQRLNLLEPPHMHTSMLFVARGRPIPAVGDWLDVQKPLTQVQVDLLQWARN